jgi:hypothetical protein
MRNVVICRELEYRNVTIPVRQKEGSPHVFVTEDFSGKSFTLM